MQKACFALRAALTLGFFGFSATALEATAISAEPGALAPDEMGAQRDAPQGDLAAVAPCQKVVVAIDEGYGVSGHETRDDCRRRR